MIGISQKGDFTHTENFFKRVKRNRIRIQLEKYGKIGAAMLALNTPIDTGKTASSWGYRIDEKPDGIRICWTNDNRTETGIPIAVLIQYGHATGNGGYVQGRDYINPAIQPVFDDIAKNIWEEVSKL